jgi:hypothetical protein
MNQTDNVHPIRDNVSDYLENMMNQPRLKSGSGGGTSDGMDTVDAKIAASEARTDTKFAELRSDLKDFATKSTVWQAAATIVAIILAAIAFGGDRFDAGIGMADHRQAQMQRDQAQDQSVKRIEGKIDQLIEAQKAPQKQP